MRGINIQEMSFTGIQLGVGIAVIPVAVTTLITCSKIILINIIVNIVVRILTANQYSVSTHGISLVPVPFLWKASRIAAMVGATIIGLSLIAAVVDRIYQRYAAPHRET